MFNNLLTKLHKLAWELLKTFSNKASLLSSKRIERAIAFNTVEVLTILFVWHTRNKLTATDFVITISPLLTFAGFNSIMTSKEQIAKKELKNETENTPS
jgi:hypothetical protein